MSDRTNELWIVVPAYNESAWIGSTIDALALQEGVSPTVLVVDNASNDGTAAVAEAAGLRHPELDVRVIREDEKGTGSACDTGFRHAIAHGATFILRTDADCLPAPTWAARMHDALDGGLDLVGGNYRARTDDGTAPFGAAVTVPLVYGLIRFVGRIRPDNNCKGEGYRAPYLLTPGGNMGIRAITYVECGGFPRTKIEDVHEDKQIVNRVRKVSSNLGYRRDAIVRYSNRRAAHGGIVNNLRWYLNHGGGSEVVDVR
ncbi:MAG: glycosyltransferase family 2 protein [Mycolicibacterium cosmeticum]|nr:glycosyltransferase family 2 protein [Mycolicibacterium cosmeticum]